MLVVALKIPCLLLIGQKDTEMLQYYYEDNNYVQRYGQLVDPHIYFIQANPW